MIIRAFTEESALRSRMRPTVVIAIVACVWALAGLIAITGAFAVEDRKGKPTLPEPFTMTLEAKRPQLPEPFTMTLEAKRPTLPEPFTMTLEAKRPELPEPFTMTLEAKRPKVPEPFTMTLEAKRPELPEPFIMTLEAKRPELPEPFIMTLEAKRPELPEPFTMTLEAKRLNPCGQLAKDFDAAVALTEKGQLGAAKQALDKIDTTQCPDLGPKIDAEQTRISSIADKSIADAGTALAACEFKNSRELINRLPEGSRAALVTRWNDAYKTERKARDLVKQARVLQDQGNLDKALAKLREARELKPCESTIAAIDKVISDIGQRGVSEAETALGACQFKDSRDLINKLPEGPRAALVTRWNEAYKTERKARDLVKQAIALKDQGDLDKALAKLREARELKPCESTIAAIDKVIGDIGQRGVSEAETALAACEFKNSRELINKLPEGPRAVLVKRWNDAYKTERKARDLVKQAMALKDQGLPKSALQKLHKARNLDPCESTIAAIDEAIGRIEQGAAEEKKIAKAQCETDHGSAAYAVPDGTGGFRCECSAPYKMSATTKRCTKEPTREEQKVAASEGCKSTFGPHAVAVPKNGSYEGSECRCAPGYTWADPDASTTRCVKQTPAQQKAAATADCQEINRSSGYYAGDPTGDGRYHCVPNKTVANAWCNNKYQGSGWTAINIKGDGSFDCYKSPRGQTGPSRSPSGRTPGRGQPRGCPNGWSRVRGKCLQDHLVDEMRDIRRLLQ